MIDRGPKSRQVIELIQNNNYDCVIGNHEQMMIEQGYQSFDNHYNYPNIKTNWQFQGGDSTIASYSNKKEFLIHLEWMKNLPIVKEYPQIMDNNDNSLIVSHSSCADISDLNDLSGNAINNILWNRKSVPKKIPNKFNVFGHTPSHKNPLIKDHFSNIDSGCYLNGSYGIKYLSALQFPDMIVYKQECLDFNKKYESAFGEVE